ncbi:MAG TPA: helix-turn-helix transcriptional regulator [Patescibacteria group bacterium]|jgi:predicted transcriptional regulator|nr:helix-turn-helix transcriptional regulator [Patescibacteria group bacterium]
MKTFTRFKTELLKDKDVAREYKKLTPRYQVISGLIAARLKKGITQKELADKIGTKQSAIARLESGSVNPSLGLLEKIASVMGYRLTVQLQ